MKTQRVSAGAFFAECKDLLAGAAFPVMLSLILSASIISYAGYGDDVGLSVAAVVVGDILLAASFFIFGRQSGITAYRKSVQQAKKRELGAADFPSDNRIGEYAVWKGFAIALIACVPYMLVQVIGSAAPNSVCDFLLRYAFGWAYYPLSFLDLPTWLNLLWVLPFTGVHAAAYAVGGKLECERQKKVAEAEQMKGKKGKK